MTSNGLLGGVGVWSLRMSEAFAGGSAITWTTLILRNESTEDQTRWFVKPGHPNLSFFDYDSRDRKDLLRARLADRLAEADVVLPNYVLAAWEAAAVLRRKGRTTPRLVSVVHSDHELFYDLTRRFAPVLDGVVAVSDLCGRLARDECRGYAPLLETIPYGVPVPDRPPVKPDVPPVQLLYAGRLSEHQKRVSLFVPLVQRLLDEGIPFRLDIFGGGPAEASLREELSRLGGPVAFHGASPLYAMADVFAPRHVQLLLSDHEGLPLAILEGMAFGVVPLVTAVRSGIPELVRQGETGFQLPVEDPVPEATRVIATLARRPELLESLGHRAHREVVQQYRLELSVSRWTQFLEQLLARPPALPPDSWTVPELHGFGRPSILDAPFMPRALALALRRIRHPSRGN